MDDPDKEKPSESELKREAETKMETPTERKLKARRVTRGVAAAGGSPFAYPGQRFAARGTETPKGSAGEADPSAMGRLVMTSLGNGTANNQKEKSEADEGNTTKPEGILVLDHECVLTRSHYSSSLPLTWLCT
jgi:hypothetical protein